MIFPFCIEVWSDVEARKFREASDERVKLLLNFNDWRDFVDFQRDVKFTWPHHGLILACFFHKVFHPQRKKGRKSRNEFIDFLRSLMFMEWFWNFRHSHASRLGGPLLTMETDFDCSFCHWTASPFRLAWSAYALGENECYHPCIYNHLRIA